MPKPLSYPKIIKKKHSPFRRHHADRYKRLSRTGYRKPRGIDNCMRRKFRGTRPMPNKGYRTDKRTRYLLPNKFYKYPVSNIQDLEVLLMQNRKYAAEISGTVSVRKRLEIVERAAQLDIKVINANARIRTQDAE